MPTYTVTRFVTLTASVRVHVDAADPNAAVIAAQALPASAWTRGDSHSEYTAVQEDQR